MPAEVSLVLRAEDAFSAAFARLEAAFQASSTRGVEAGTAFAGLRQQIDGVGGAATAAGEALRLNGETLLQQEVLLQGELTAVQRGGQAAREQALGAHLHAVTAQERAAGEQRIAIAVEQARRRFDAASEAAGALTTLARSQGTALFNTAKQIQSARALIDAYAAANNALAAVPFPANIGAAALVLAQGLANLKTIQDTSVAHGGLEQVPADATYLLRQGERVLSPAQNRDLTRFLDGAQGAAGSPGGVHVEQLTVRVLDNATQAGALLQMSVEDWRQVVAERIVPALDALARRGVRPLFLEGNL